MSGAWKLDPPRPKPIRATRISCLAFDSFIAKLRIGAAAAARKPRRQGISAHKHDMRKGYTVRLVARNEGLEYRRGEGETGTLKPTLGP